MGIRVTLNQLAELTGKTYRTIRKNLEKGKILPVEVTTGKHFFDSAEALACLMAGERKPTEEENYRDLLEQEKWREKRRENDLAEALVAPIDLLGEALDNVTSQLIPILDALPLEMKRMNPKLTGHDITIVKKAVARCRNAMAEVRIQPE